MIVFTATPWLSVLSHPSWAAKLPPIHARKKKLNYLFVLIGFIVFCCFQNHLLLLIKKCHLPLFCNILEQGRCNDLIQQNVDNKTKNDNCLSSSIIVSSDSVHCNPLTQCTVSSGLSCQTTANSCEKEDVESFVGLNCIPTPPLWVHVFAKRSSTTSLHTQCAAAASMDVKSPKVFHRRLHRAKKRQHKIDEILREVIVPPNQFKLTLQKIDAEIIVFDGGDSTTLPIKSPDGVLWRSISVHLLHVEDETKPTIGLTYPKILGVHPFIRMPRQMSWEIIEEVGLEKITNSLRACEKLRRTALGRGDAKPVFTDYGKRLSYTCVGPQPSRNSKTVTTQPPIMNALSDSHWRSLVWMMKRAKMSLCAIADHAVLSHLDLVKKVVPFKTFTSSMADHPANFNAQFFGGIAFGNNVFLCCHTDGDFTFSIIQVFLMGKSQYWLDDQVVAYFCFPTMVLPFPYILEITYCLMQEYLIVSLLDANSKMRYSAHQLIWKWQLSVWIITIFHSLKNRLGS